MQQVLNKYLEEFKKLGVPYEIVVVNDGCTDGSEEILLETSKLNRVLRIINLDGRHGKQAAITAGMQAIAPDSEVVILADIDILNPVGILKILLDEYAKGEKIVYARREHYGFDRIRMKLNDRMVKIGARIFGVEGKYTGKTNATLFARPVADVIIALPDRNKFARTMDNWLGWKIKYIEYASGYNKTEERNKLAAAHKAAVTRPQVKSHKPIYRDKVREHSASIDICYGLLAMAGVFVILGIVLAVGVFNAVYWIQLIVWLGVILVLAIALMFYMRAILIKRVGIIHGKKTEKIYTIKSVVN